MNNLILFFLIFEKLLFKILKNIKNFNVFKIVF